MRRLVLAGSAFAVALVTAVAPPAEAAPSTLAFATFNVCKTDCEAPAPGWDVRRERVARVIAESGADVIGLQEATWQPTAFAKTQLQDIANLIAPQGYVQPPYTKASQQCAWTAADPHRCTHGSTLFYRSSTVRPFVPPVGDSAGVVNESMIAAGLDEDSAKREVAWAYLEPVSGGAPFLALSAHTSTFKDPVHEAGRVTFATALSGWSDAWNAQHGMPGTAVVLMADLNSYAMRQPNGAQKVLEDTGWVDTANAPDTRNDDFSTINVNPLNGNTGWPAKPYKFNRKATRIDYVFARGAVTPVAYEVVMRVKPDGCFDPNYQASDHQMVRAVLTLSGAEPGE